MGTGTTGADPVDARVWARRVARAAVHRVAPEELAFFDAAAAGGGRARRGRRDPLAFGLTEVVTLVTPVALAVATAVADDLVGRTGTAVVDGGRRGARWLRGRFGKPRRELVAPPVFEPRELARIRDLARAKALALGLPADQVDLFVDALIGGLAFPEPPADEPRAE